MPTRAWLRYKKAPQRELTEEEQITVNNGGTLAPTAAPGGIAGTGIGLAQVAPPPPPEANLAYKKSGESSNGVMAMIDLIVADVDKEITTMELEEKDAQKDYEGWDGPQAIPTSFCLMVGRIFPKETFRSLLSFSCSGFHSGLGPRKNLNLNRTFVALVGQLLLERMVE